MKGGYRAYETVIENGKIKNRLVGWSQSALDCGSPSTLNIVVSALAQNRRKRLLLERDK